MKTKNEQICTFSANSYSDYFVRNPVEKESWFLVYGKQNVHNVEHSDYTATINYIMNNWIEVQIQLAEGLRILHTRNYAYGDFNLTNIILSDDCSSCRLVDYGSCNIMKINNDSFTEMQFLPHYNNYAPELDYVAGMITGTEATVDKIYESKSILNEIDEMYPSSIGILEELRNFSNRHPITFLNDATLIVKKYGLASDMWAFGYTFFKLYMKFLTIPEFFQKYHSRQMRILRGLLHADPRNRFTVDDLLMELYTIRMES
jgi:serine/threonine protein kinase